MVSEFLTPPNLDYLFAATSNLVKLPAQKMWLDYDAEVDVLYIHFEDTPTATHSESAEDGIILDYRNETLVGITVLDASLRKPTRQLTA